MYFRHLLGTLSLLSIIVSASIDYSDFMPADDALEPVLATLPVDQVTLSSDELSPLFDQTTSLFSEEPSSSSPDSFTGFDVFPDAENTSSDLSLDQSFKLASCSTSDASLAPALGKSRLRRVDDASSCPNPAEHDAILESIQTGKFSLTCTLVTKGVLPFAMAQSDGFRSVVTDTRVLNTLSPLLGFGPRLYYPSTLYRATLRKSKALPASSLSTLSTQIEADLTV